MANLELLESAPEVTNVIPMDAFRRRRDERAAVQFALGMGPNPHADDPDAAIESAFTGEIAQQIHEAADENELTPTQFITAAVSRAIEAAKLERDGWETKCTHPVSIPTVWGNIPSPFLPPREVTFKPLRDTKAVPAPTQLHSI